MLFVNVLIVFGLIASGKGIKGSQCKNRNQSCVPEKFCESNNWITKGHWKNSISHRTHICHWEGNKPWICCNNTDLPKDKPCVYRDTEPGLCVAPLKCRSVANYLKNRRRNKYFDEEMEKNLCHRDHEGSYYCCPEGTLVHQRKTVSKQGPTISPKSSFLETDITKRPSQGMQNVFAPCEDPEGKSGFCVPINQCYRISNTISQGGNLTNNKSIRHFIKMSRCPSDGRGGHWVCCAGSQQAKLSSFNNLIDHPNAKKLGLTNCGQPKVDRLQDKIHGGQEAGLGRYPWMANLLYLSRDKLEPRCSGSLIHERYVLTAAHCLKEKYDPLKVRLGEYNLDTNPDCDDEGYCLKPYRDYAIDKRIVHENFHERKTRSIKKHLDYDIGLVRLKSKADTSMEHIQPICLPLSIDLQILKPKQLKVTGWGLKKHGAPASELMEANMRTGSWTELCKGESLFSAKGFQGECHCRGDSGGPFQTPVLLDNHLKYVVFGIVSRGSLECIKNGPGCGVMVGYHLNWILDHMDI
ncbi:serine protease grass-like [Uranotaenia lowii]|uniref:serine protease grass-like n=1 Tax=Uranotaenia lowii TaxID=190385 RepID=UPI002478C7AA|nr:serine protease grass-like [Uranotaenia lowii]